MKILKTYYPEITGLLIFILYIITLAPSVIQIDSGELAAVQIKLGITHPTGYPLFTILGFIFSLLPLPASQILQANLLSAIYCSIAVIFIIKAFRIIMDSYTIDDSALPDKTRRDKKKKNNVATFINLPDWVKPAIAVFGGVTLALSSTFWMQSTSVEVYPLHILLISALIYFLIRVVGSRIATTKDWIIIALLFGLAFTNHMTSLLLIPGTLYLYYNLPMENKYSLKTLAKPGLVFVLTLIIIYLYLPLRASYNPVLNWGNPVDIDNLIRHVSGAQYRVWLFSSLDAAKLQFVKFFTTLPEEFTYPVLLLAVIGLINSYKFSKRLFIFFTVNFAFTVLYSSNYDIKDLETYYLLAYISLSFFALNGIYKIILEFYKREFKPVVTVTFLVCISAFQLYSNFSKVDQSDVYIFEDYTKELINSTDANSIVFSYQWDYFLSASYYFQYCENFREDVIVIDKELLRRSWYYDQLENNYGNIFAGFESDVDGFLTALKPFENGEQFDSNRLEHFYQSIMTNLIKYNFDEHPYYIAPELVENEMKSNQFKLPQSFSLVPDLFLFKVVNNSEYSPAPDPDYKLRIPGNPNMYHKFIENIAVKMLIYRALYEIQFNKPERARIYAQKIITDFPGYDIPDSIKKTLSL